jgi:hypothetical protein
VQAEKRSHGVAQTLSSPAGISDVPPYGQVYDGIAYAITTEDEARKAVQELAQIRVDIVKIWVDDRDGRAKELPINLSSLIISESHKVGLKVIAHIFYHKDADELAAAGIDAFAHLVRDKVMSDGLIATMKEKGIYVMPNLGYPESSGYTTPPAWLDEPYLAGLLRDVEPADAIAHLRKSFSEADAAAAESNRKKYEILKASVAKLTAAGARIILGSDTGLPDHFSLFPSIPARSSSATEQPTGMSLDAKIHARIAGSAICLIAPGPRRPIVWGKS